MRASQGKDEPWATRWISSGRLQVSSIAIGLWVCHCVYFAPGLPRGKAYSLNKTSWQGWPISLWPDKAVLAQHCAVFWNSQHRVWDLQKKEARIHTAFWMEDKSFYAPATFADLPVLFAQAYDFFFFFFLDREIEIASRQRGRQRPWGPGLLIR